MSHTNYIDLHRDALGSSVADEMNVSDYLSDDGLVLLALCSAFALPEAGGAGGPAPFTLSEWNKLARQIHDSPLKQPAALARPHCR